MSKNFLFDDSSFDSKPPPPPPKKKVVSQSNSCVGFITLWVASLGQGHKNLNLNPQV